jgi:hypothetical protein
MSMNWKEGMKRIALSLTVLSIIFWIVYALSTGFFAPPDPGDNSYLTGNFLTLLGLTALTVGAIWAVYGLAYFIIRSFTQKKTQ